MKLSDSGIVWEGECPHCKGGLISPFSLDIKNKAIKKESCHKCNGTGKLTRNATLEEVVEVCTKLIALDIPVPFAWIHGVNGFDAVYKEALTISGGILKIRRVNGL